MTIYYYDNAGSLVSSSSHSIAGRGYAGVWQGDPAEGLSSGFNGSAKIVSNQQIAAIVNVTTSSGYAFSYNPNLTE